MALKGNIGDWSEIYALFKVLGEKKLYVGSDDLKRIEGAVYPIISVLRSEKKGDFQYSLNDDVVVVSSDNKELLRLSVESFLQQSVQLLEELKKRKKMKGSFSIIESEAFMSSINIESLKADSSQKTDITIIIHDAKTSQTPQLGFSIKSQLGSPSTLLNAGKTTNFRYQINAELSDTDVAEINKISGKGKVKKRINRIIDMGGKLEFRHVERPIFSNNLILIDSLLPQILSEIVFDYYHSDRSALSDLVSNLHANNPLQFNLAHHHQFYNYKIKRFLTDVALGMMPSKVWDGKADATGGYLIVKDDGELLCYHVYNRNEFENYLLQNTKLETASTSRHAFATVYREDNCLYINLNLQIRFIK